MIDVKLTSELVRGSRVVEEAMTIDRSYKKRLHASYDHEGYWDWSRASIPGNNSASGCELPLAKGAKK